MHYGKRAAEDSGSALSASSAPSAFSAFSASSASSASSAFSAFSAFSPPAVNPFSRPVVPRARHGDG